MGKPKKPFIVAIEGIDGSGKSTLSANLGRLLLDIEDLSSKYYITVKHFPSQEIKQKAKEYSPDIRVREYLMDMKRFMDLVMTDDPNRIVILDRYYYSTLAYQPLLPDGRPITAVEQELIKLLPEPDLVIYLNDLPELCWKRSVKDDQASELGIEFLTKVAEAYEKIFSQKDNVIFIDKLADTNQDITVEQYAQLLTNIVSQMLRTGDLNDVVIDFPIKD